MDSNSTPAREVLKVFRCPDCEFKSADAEVAFQHVMMCKKGNS